MILERRSCCKVNLLLNILGRRPDGFHELETVLLPVPIVEDLRFERAPSDVVLTCNHPDLPVDGGNLVHRAATRFLAEAGIRDGVRIQLTKRLPLSAGLGGGSANAAATLLALDELFEHPLTRDRLAVLAAGLGSDVPFFLGDGPAIGTGRGERIEPLPPFAALRGRGMILVHPGFGVSTPWAYQALARFPEAVNGRPGRARELAAALERRDPARAASLFYNALEAPVLEKHPLLGVFQDFFRAEGALSTLMSGSGSTTFAITDDLTIADRLAVRFRERFGSGMWIATVGL